METIEQIIARWDSNEGKPYKGRLIDYGAYKGDGATPPTDIGCMCAQGQVLHLLGGWEPKRLYIAKQQEADKATAKLLNISVTHAVLLRDVNDSVDGAPSIVLTDPAKVLGDQWSKLLDFWWWIDQTTPKDWPAAWPAARDAAWDAARDAAWPAARDAAWDAARDAARDAAWDAAGDAAGAAAANVSSEIQGAEILRANESEFFFLKLFGFTDPNDIPARPANYGVPQ